MLLEIQQKLSKNINKVPFKIRGLESTNYNYLLG